MEKQTGRPERPEKSLSLKVKENRNTTPKKRNETKDKLRYSVVNDYLYLDIKICLKIKRNFV